VATDRYDEMIGTMDLSDREGRPIMDAAMEIKELLEVYKALFETWRFEVNSHWQRSSYFAAFETVAVAACWKLLDGGRSAWAGLVLAVLGIGLTEIWRRNNNKTHLYAVYWLKRVTDLETRISERTGETIDFATAILNRPRTDRIRHRDLVQAVPMLFFATWLMMLLMEISRFSPYGITWLKVHQTGLELTYDMTALIVSIASLLV
jgi:hypothetical protein